MVLLALPSADHRLIESDRGQFVPSLRRRMMTNVGAERLLKIPAEPSPELRIPGAAAQTRVLSMAGIRLGFLGIRASFQRDNLRRHFGVRVLHGLVPLDGIGEKRIPYPRPN